MASRGERLVEMARKPRRSILKQIENLLRENFFATMEKCQRFIDVVKTPQQLRRMVSSECNKLKTKYARDDIKEKTGDETEQASLWRSLCTQ